MRRFVSLLVALAAVLLVAVGNAAANAPAAAEQAAGADNSTAQAAGSGAGALQAMPRNVVVPVRVLSPGDDGGSVEQSNKASADAVAANGNETDQSIEQSQGGVGSGGLGVQAAGQDNSTAQGAHAGALAAQLGAANAVVPVRVLSPGDDGGSVEQSNKASADAVAANGNETDQSIEQSQGGVGSGGLGVQAAGQDNSTAQGAHAGALAAQLGAANAVVPVRVLSPGDDGGSVEQSNKASADAVAANGNETDQSIEQSQGGVGSGGLGVQAAGQSNYTLQRALAIAFGLQL